MTIDTPEAISDHFTGDLVPVIVDSRPPGMVGMVWMDDFNGWSDPYLRGRVEMFLQVWRMPTARTVTRTRSTAGRPYVLVTTEDE